MSARAGSRSTTCRPRPAGTGSRRSAAAPRACSLRADRTSSRRRATCRSRRRCRRGLSCSGDGNAGGAGRILCGRALSLRGSLPILHPSTLSGSAPLRRANRPPPPLAMTDSSLPDLKAGVSLSTLADGAMLRGRVDGEDALLLRQGDALYAVGAQCTHYHAELAACLLQGPVLHCPMHHAQFDIRSGEALCAPALDPLSCWRVERVGEQAFVRERIVAPPRSHRNPPLADVVIVGGGAAGLAAADMLRREGYDGQLLIDRKS